MKRYFHTSVQPTNEACAHNYLNLPDGSFLVCMFNEWEVPSAAWTELPHLLENTPIPANVVTALTGLVPATALTTMFQLSKMLAGLNPQFHA